MAPRLGLLVAAFVVAYGAVIFNLYQVQIVKGPYYVAQTESQYVAAELMKAERGVIYFTDKNDNRVPVITNKNFPLIYAVPKVIEDAEEAAAKLVGILDIPREDLISRFKKTSSSYDLLKKKADFSIAGKIEDLKLKGIFIRTVPERFYSLGSAAAHLLGYVGPNSSDNGESGHYGVEEFYNETLSGRAGETKGDKIIFPESGKSVTLTIDSNIQIEAERILNRVISNYRAKAGSVIVEEVGTGKILAMGSSPGFNPNSYSEFKIKDFLNPVTQKIYEPGSVFKVITMAAGIDSGKITPETTFNDTGKLVLNGKKIQNWDLKAHGVVTMTNVIEQSINTGAAFAQRQTGDETFKKYLAKFGFGEVTGIDLPGEVTGSLRPLGEGAPAIAFASASFGQGVAVTPIQLVSAMAAIANGGVLMRPYVNADLEPKEVRRVISEDSAKKVAKMMVSAVDKAEVAAIKGFSFAGKTGTAQVPERGGYSDRVINTYVGFGPTKNPRFIILFKLDEPEGAPLAGLTVVPAFRDLAQFIVNYYNIPPDRL